MLNWLSEKLFPDDGDGNTQPSPVSPEVGAAALLIEAAHRDSNYTEIERDLATGAIMKMFHFGNAEAVALRREAEAAQAHVPYMMRFASAAQKLEADAKEQLVTYLWAMIDSDREDLVTESQLVHSVIDILGISKERARALRLPAPKRND